MGNFKHNYSHRGPRTPEYRAWQAMKSRCMNPNRPNYHLYGGRGLLVEPEWLTNFTAFLSEVGNKPEGTTLGRINNELGYIVGNVRWEDKYTQERNKRTNKWLTHNGETLIYADWAKYLKITREAFNARVHRWPKDRWFEAKNK